MSSENQQKQVSSKKEFGKAKINLDTPVAKPKNTAKTLKRLLRYLNRYWLQIIATLICICFTTIGTLIATRLIGTAIDEYIPVFDFVGLGRICLVMTVIYVCSSLFTWVHMYLMLQMAQNIVTAIRKEMFEKLQRLPLKYFDSTTHGELMSRVTNDVENISNALNGSVSQLMQGTLTFISTLGMMLYLSVPLTIATIIIIPVMLFTTCAVAKRAKRQFKERQKKLGDLNGKIEEIISGQKVVKVFHREDKEIEIFSDLNSDLLETSIKAEIYSGVVGPIMTALNNLSYAIVVGAGGFMMVLGYGGVTLGTISNFIIYSRQFTRPLNELASQVNTIMSALAGAERVFELLDETEETEDRAEAVELNEAEGDILFDDVYFSYDEGHPILKDINLYARPGQTIAFVGPTGAGKTTIINLLTRFYDIDAGRIQVDGHDIYNIKRRNLRSLLGIVLQDTYLFTASIRENIRYGRLDATEEEIVQAAKLANAHEFIRRLPDSYDTKLIDGGGNLSQGQRQMLAIARAILANPKILILDEATSSVDTRTEAKIQEAMNTLMKGRTNFVIAHRLSTIKNADLIAVIDGGKIIERGNHEQLMEKKGFYYTLYSNQFETDEMGA